MATTTLVSVEEYLHTSYDPDCDFVDGVVEERNLGEAEHGALQTETAIWVATNLKRVGISAITELRMKVSQTRYRVPDLVLFSGKRPARGVLQNPPLAAIEILSPEDRISRMQARMDDYLNIGVPHCWLIDPETRRAWAYTKTGSTELHDLILRGANPDFEIPLKEIFQSIDEQAEA